MQAVEARRGTANASFRRPNVWRDFARLAVEGLSIGLFVSVVLGLAVLVVASQAHASPRADASPAHGELRLDAASTDGTAAVAAPLLSTDVHIAAGAMIARVEVTQRFRNPGDVWREGVYVFPLPESSAVDHLRMRVGERVIEGMIRERGDAKRAYDDAKREGRKASLVEQERPNVFTTSVAHIGPGEEVVVTIEYQQTLSYDAGAFGLRFPMAMTPRYIPGDTVVAGDDGSGTALNTDRVPDAARITPAVAPARAGVNPVSIAIDLSPGFALSKLESRYHAIHASETADHRIHVELAAGTLPSDRDFELTWTPDVGAAPGAALYTETLADKRYALLMLVPPTVDERASTRLPRETVFVIDTSGSMEGVSIEQAKRALAFALDRLAPSDRFNVIEFNSTMRAFASSPVAATADAIDAAHRFVAALHAGGGTEMRPALDAALASPPVEGFVRQVVFLTDGAVGNESDLLAMIEAKLADRRLFTIGIGPAPNTWFLAKAAQFGRGTFTFIGDVREVGDKMSALFRKLESPVLTDIAIEWPAEAEASSARVADLYAGEPLVVSARLDSAAASGAERVRISGRRGAAPWHAEIALDAAAEASGVRVAWARAKLESIADASVGGKDAASRATMLALALDHHLVSRYTSLVAVDVTPTAPSGTTSAVSPMPVNLPQGLSENAILGVPQTATPAPLDLVVGTLALLLAALLWGARGKREAH